MGKNLEIKVKTPSHENLIEILKSKNADYKGILVQKDIYYKVSGGILKLRIENGTYCLIKYNRDEKNPERWSNYNLLYLSGDDPVEYLTGLFEELVTVEKKRTLYIFNHTRIHLDDVKNLGLFLELETVADGITDEEAKKEFGEIVKFLKLDFDNQIKKSYKDLLLEKITGS